jgi:hypothetical protein
MHLADQSFCDRVEWGGGGRRALDFLDRIGLHAA